MKSKENTPAIPPHWPRLIDSVERPESVLKWSESEDGWDAYLTELWGNGLFPLAYRSWREGNVLERLPEPARAEAEVRMTRYRAGSAASWAEIEKLLALFLREGFQPVPLKGTHLAIRYYPEVHLRPISDLDVLFTNLEEAEKAFLVMREAGFIVQSSLDVRNPWRLSQHLPTLVNPESGLPVDIHGSLLYAPCDRRWKGGGRLLTEGLSSFEFRKMELLELNAEANIVYLSGHTFGKHGDTPKASVLYDLKLLIESASVDWNRVESLAGTSRLHEETAVALAMLDGVFSMNVLSFCPSFQAPSYSSSNIPRSAGKSRRGTLKLMFYSGGSFGPFCFLANMIILPADSLRKRYPKFAGWPSFVLHFIRFSDLVWKTVKALAGVMTGKR